MIKNCEICGAEFETLTNGTSRKYCFKCSPSYPKGGSRAETIKTMRKAMKQEVVKRLGGKCCRCGYNKCIAALVFHHRNPKEKKFALSADKNIHSWEDYLAEAQKCDLLCSNCHAEIHRMEE